MLMDQDVFRFLGRLDEDTVTVIGEIRSTIVESDEEHNIDDLASVSCNPIPVLVDFVDKYRTEYGVQSICREVELALDAQPSSNRRLRPGPSAYCERKAQQREPARRCERTQWEGYLREEIK